MNITFDFLEEHKYSSVTDYCRDLVKTEGYPEYLYVYRGEMLCLTVNVKKAALIEPTSSVWQKYAGKRQSKGRGCV